MKKRTSDPLAALYEHHPLLMIGGALLFGAALGNLASSAVDDASAVYRRIKGNARGEYGS